MTLFSDAKLALQEELDATDDEIRFLFHTFLTSLKETQAALTETNLATSTVKSYLHKLKGEAYSVNLNPWARIFERMEDLCLNPQPPSSNIQDDLNKHLDSMIQALYLYTQDNG